MPFLNLKRLMPPKKVWQLITKKLIKLHKLNRSTANKKPKFPPYKSPKKLGLRFLSIQPKKFKPKPKRHAVLQLHKRPPPVYVDQLFIDQPVSVVKEQRKLKPLLAEREEGGEQEPCSSNLIKKNRLIGTSVDEEADDMWENLVMSSPHEMHGINERAEEFIARFRADMHSQELLARRRL